MTELRNRSIDTMYRPGRIAGAVADCAVGLAMVAVGLFLIAVGLSGAAWL